VQYNICHKKILSAVEDQEEDFFIGNHQWLDVVQELTDELPLLKEFKKKRNGKDFLDFTLPE
jgi:hypothetical protein